MSCWGGCCSINQQRQLALIVLWWDTSGNSVTQLSLGRTHSRCSSRCSHTPSTNAIGHSVCGFSLHDSQKATATPSKHTPPSPWWPSAEILGKTLLGLKEWFVWNAEQMKRTTLILSQAGDDFSYVYIWTYIPNYLRVDWLWYTWSEAKYTAINVRPFFFFTRTHARLLLSVPKCSLAPNTGWTMWPRQCKHNPEEEPGSNSD